LSFDYIYDAKDTLMREGYPFLLAQFTPTRARYAWDMQGTAPKPMCKEDLVAELRRLANRIEQGKM